MEGRIYEGSKVTAHGSEVNVLCSGDPVVSSVCHLPFVRTGVDQKLRVAGSWPPLCTSLLCDPGMVTPLLHTCSLSK